MPSNWRDIRNVRGETEQALSSDDAADCRSFKICLVNDNAYLKKVGEDRALFEQVVVFILRCKLSVLGIEASSW